MDWVCLPWNRYQEENESSNIQAHWFPMRKWSEDILESISLVLIPSGPSTVLRAVTLLDILTTHAGQTLKQLFPGNVSGYGQREPSKPVKSFHIITAKIILTFTLSPSDAGVKSVPPKKSVDEAHRSECFIPATMVYLRPHPSIPGKTLLLRKQKLCMVVP
jgi:hypothetical protein